MRASRIITKSGYFLIGIAVGVAGMLLWQAVVIASMPAELAYRPVTTYCNSTARSPYIQTNANPLISGEWRDKEGWFPPFGTFIVPGTPWGSGQGGPRTLELPEDCAENHNVPEPGTLWLVLLATVVGGVVYGIAWLRDVVKDMDSLEKDDSDE